MDIEKNSYPGAQNNGGGGGVTQAKPITPYVRKKKGSKTQVAHGEHTQHICETTSLENVLSSSSTPIDASQENAEMQLHSFTIQLSPPHSTPQISSDVFMIDNMEISNFPSIQAKPITHYVRKKKGSKTQVALGEHTQHIPETTSLENVLSSSSTPIDTSQENAEMQLHSLTIQLSPPYSTPQISSDVFMIDNMEISNFPSLKLMGEPTISIYTHHSE